MGEALLEWRDYNYFPYEREFARLEVERVFNTQPAEDELGLRIDKSAFRPADAERLTYFARVQDSDGSVLIPRQARLEATATEARQERQATRYSAHGIHEYKGKFNPQVVRAIGNMLGLGEGAFVLDPFSGSGTTLLECAHAGWSALGFDINPLAVQIANAKIRALQIADGRLEQLAYTIRTELQPYLWLAEEIDLPLGRVNRELGSKWKDELPSLDYLSSWFPKPVLAQAAVALRVIRSVAKDRQDQAIFEVLLSDRLRDCSWQDPADLRIRRRKDPASNYPLLTHFDESVQTRLARVSRARAEIGHLVGSQVAMLQDVTTEVPISAHEFGWGRFDAIITSPPYASALPYIDTQRLSLVLLGYVPAKAIRSTEARLIGARELTKRERLKAEDAIRSGDDALPPQAIEFCRRLLAAASKPGNGFRRLNTPALIYRYLRHMSLFFEQVKSAVKPQARAAFVVGVNKTELGGDEFIISTPELISAVAEHRGFRLVEYLSMDTYPRYDLHKQNSINAEKLVVLEAPA